MFFSSRNGWYAGKSLYNTVHEMWTGRAKTDDIQFDVSLINGKLLSLNNCRLAIVKQLQGLFWHRLDWVRCVVSDQDHPKFRSSYTTRYGGFGLVPNRSKGVARHDGVLAFQPMQAFVQQAGKIVMNHTNAKLEAVVIRTSGDHEPLTLAPSDRHDRTEDGHGDQEAHACVYVCIPCLCCCSGCCSC